MGKRIKGNTNDYDLMTTKTTNNMKLNAMKKGRRKTPPLSKIKTGSTLAFLAVIIMLILSFTLCNAKSNAPIIATSSSLLPWSKNTIKNIRRTKCTMPRNSFFLTGRGGGGDDDGDDGDGRQSPDSTTKTSPPSSSSLDQSKTETKSPTTKISKNDSSSSSSSVPSKKSSKKKKGNTTKIKQPQEKKKSSTTTTTSTAIGGGKSGECLRRIKREWRDAVKLGIAYNWITMETIVVRTTKKQKRMSSKKKIHNEEDANTKNETNYNYVRIGPYGKNLLQWHFSVQGPPNSVYSRGVYHGRVLLPRDYPGSPPRIQVLTPSGRFIPGHDICLSASSYHPESWTPRWTILSLIDALRLHMLTTPNEIGGVRASDERRRELAEQSRVWCKRGLVDHRRMIAAGIFAFASTTAAKNNSESLFREEEEEVKGSMMAKKVKRRKEKVKEEEQSTSVQSQNDSVDSVPMDVIKDEDNNKSHNDKEEENDNDNEVIDLDNVETMVKKKKSIQKKHHRHETKSVNPRHHQQQLEKQRQQQQISRTAAAAAATTTATKRRSSRSNNNNEALTKVLIKAIIMDILQSPIRLAFLLFLSIFAMLHL